MIKETIETMSNETFPGMGSVISEASSLLSRATEKISGKTQNIQISTPEKSLSISIVVVLVLIVALGMGKGISEGYCSVLPASDKKRLGRAVTAMEDGVFMVVGFLILLPLLFMQGKHLYKNLTFNGTNILQKVSWVSWITITMTMLIVWIVATSKYWSVDNREEGRVEAIATVFHTAVVIVVGLLAIAGATTAAFHQAK